MIKHSKISGVFVIAGILALLAVGFFLFQDSDDPIIALSPKTDRVSLTLPLTVTVTDQTSPIKRVAVTVRLGNRLIPVSDQTFNDAEKSRQVTFTLKDTGLKDSVIELEVTATDASLASFGRGNTATQIIPLTIDSTPPRISIKTSPPNVRRGGSACILYAISKEVSQTGVKVGDLFFPAFRQPNGDYLCFFAFPYYLDTKTYSPQLVAVDLAGNAQVSPINQNAMHRDFKHDTISVGQGFLDAKAVEFEAMAPGQMTDKERFLEVNGRIRRENAQKLLEIGKDTAAEALWSGPFLRMPNSAPRAGFADFRTYLWDGEKVDEQTHLGFDLASVAQAPIPAANSGRVVFAGYLGIYGNLVVIDHGLGLQSLYSHMTGYQVEVGQVIKKGDIIGNTGATGMAGGDHLHFGILISGLEVTPLEWLDDHWIKDNIADRIKAAGGVAPQAE